MSYVDEIIEREEEEKAMAPTNRHIWLEKRFR